MGIQHEKRKENENENEKEKKRKENKPSYVNRIATLLYSTFERVPVVFYHANLY